MNSRAFSLAEIIVVTAIIAVLAVIGVSAFMSARQSAAMNAVSDGIVSVFEQARANALSGKGGTSYGVRFSASSYTFFTGSSYNASDATNIVHQVASGYTLSNSMSASSGVVVFARLTGVPSVTGTVTITQTSPAKTRIITIGSQGTLTIQ
jgi:prepilin-type N-terminal cleavage/methylation domain-containing protein